MGAQISGEWIIVVCKHHNTVGPGNPKNILNFLLNRSVTHLIIWNYMTHRWFHIIPFCRFSQWPPWGRGAKISHGQLCKWVFYTCSFFFFLKICSHSEDILKCAKACLKTKIAILECTLPQKKRNFNLPILYFLENKLIPNNRRPSKIGAYGTCTALELENRRIYR